MVNTKDLENLTARTLGHYNAGAESFREGTWTHDVSQNYRALFSAIETPPPYTLLDFGCGPGRDLTFFRNEGHDATGLDGAIAFVKMAREATGCQVLHQNFMELSLPPTHFDGVFANASLFHVPTSELANVLGNLFASLKPGGVLFCSNPRGLDKEGFSGDRYGAYHTLETWTAHVTSVGFVPVTHYYRPEGKPRDEQPWLATVWRRPSLPAAAPAR